MTRRKRAYKARLGEYRRSKRGRGGRRRPGTFGLPIDLLEPVPCRAGVSDFRRREIADMAAEELKAKAEAKRLRRAPMKEADDE